MNLRTGRRAVRRRDEDADLQHRLAAGDGRALTEAYAAYAPAVYRQAKRILNDAGTAEDITHDVFLRLWDRPDRYDPDRGSLVAWLTTLARNQAVSQRRRAAVAQRCLRLLVCDCVPAPDCAQTVLGEATAAAVRAAVNALPESQRTALLLAYYEGLSYREVGVRLGIAEGTAKSRLRMALLRMGQLLRANGF
jgi:RNA polymerase sigma factor (sigma-70 family)